MDLVAVRPDSYNLMCRLCLSTDEYLLSIFDENCTFLPQRIAACVNVEILQTDKMPRTICKSCLARIDEWVNFKKCCDDSQAKLRQWANINSIMCNKTVNMSIGFKEDPESDLEDIQIIDNEITFIKQEPEEEIYLQLSDTEETETEQEVDPFSSQSCDPQDSSTLEVSDSLLVPTSECPATVHGMNAPGSAESIPRNTQPVALSKRCRVCHKKYSSLGNRVRHERLVHYIKDADPFDEIENFEPDITNVHSLNTDSNLDNSDCKSNSLEVSAKKISEIRTIVLSKPNTEKHFIQFNRLLSQMIANFTCFVCGMRYETSSSTLKHLCKVFTLEKFTCFLCCIAFPNRSQFMKHTTKNFCKKRSRLIQDQNCSFKAYQHYQCSICQEIHVHKILLNSHMLGYHLMPNHLPFCERCNKQFQDYNEYKEHLQDSCFYKLYCSICNNSFGTEEFAEHCHIHDDNNVEFNIYDYINKDFDCRSKVTKAENEERVNKYSCSQCGAQFPTLDMWCEHQQNHSDNNVYRCTECNRVFVTEIELIEHRSTHPNSNLKLKLYRCSDTNSYKTVSDFTSTYASHLVQNGLEEQQLDTVAAIEEKKFKCIYCKKMFRTESYLRTHKRIHTDRVKNDYRTRKRRSTRFVCPKCRRTCKTASAFVNHKNCCFNRKEKPAVKVKRESRKPIKKEIGEYSNISNDDHRCQVCDKTFLTERGLILHTKIHTSREKDSEKRQCQVCSKNFVNIETFLDHLKSHSTKSLNTLFSREKIPVAYGAYCNICDKEFINNTGLANHMRTHEHNQTNPQIKIKTEPGSATHVCNFCNMEFVSRAVLNSHVKIHLNGANIGYNCTFCPKVCANSYLLEKHVTCRHPDAVKPVKIKQEYSNYSCQICKKNFLSPSMLEKHLKIHAKAPVTKKFECTKCLKTLSSALALKRHVKNLCLHCKQCNKNFVSHRSLTRHFGWHKRIASGEPFNCSQCNLEFNTQPEYLKHITTHRTSYQCKICSKFFYSMKTLLTHTAKHKNDAKKASKLVRRETKPQVKTEVKEEKLLPMYRCTECNTTFVNSKRLRLHVLSTHLTENM